MNDVKIPIPDAQLPVLKDGAFFGHTWKAGHHAWYAKPLGGEINGPFDGPLRAAAAVIAEVITTPGLTPVTGPPGFVPTAGPAPAKALCSLHRGPMGPGQAWTTDPDGWWVCNDCVEHIRTCTDPDCDHG